MQQLPDALAPMAAYNQFCIYQLSPRPGVPGKTDKYPCDISGARKDAHDSSIWIDHVTAINVATMFGPDYGVGFVFTENDPFYFFDIDDCLLSSAEWSPMALELMARFNGAAVEVSQSGSGLHIIGTGSPTTPKDHRRKKAKHPETGDSVGLFDLYTEKRFVALTGTNIVGNVGAAADQAQLDHIVNFWLNRDTATTQSQGWTTTHVEGSTPPETDEELIAKALATRSTAGAFGAAITFEQLWNNDDTHFGEAYPDDQGVNPYDTSRVDAALAQHLAFWTGNNCERIERLMWLSGLVRDKWTAHKRYIGMTVTRAASLQTSFYSAGPPDRVPVAPINRVGVMLDGPKRREGWQFLSVDGQVELFKGCVYVQDAHKVFTPDGALLKPDQFKATYGGYVFQLEDNASGKTTKNAWEAFTESQGIQYPIANSSCFRPAIASGALIEEEGRVLVNTYIPVEVNSQPGDVGPFLDHLRRVLPVEGDRAILVAFMAACIQYKGHKFQWTPLIQGTEGNGKTLFTRCVAAAIGSRYTHMPPAGEIAEKFNEWLFRKLFIGVEDIYVPDHKKEILEILKPMITNDRIAMRAMQASQVMGDNFANFILNSNHKDAVRKTSNDRRFCIFYTAQQSAEDVKRDGMGGNYFPNLYDWLKGENKYAGNVPGYALVANYLATYAIPDALNPAGACHRAPTTSSTEEAVTASMGGVEQEIMEAIEQGRPGFAGGWVSSMAVERLLDSLRMGRAIPHNKRRELMQGLGYDWHPALAKTNGRVNNVVALDGGKPRLFIKGGHIHANLTSAAEVARQYQEAQGQPVGSAAQAFGA
jgi:hypothetical protein